MTGRQCPWDGRGRDMGGPGRSRLASFPDSPATVENVVAAPHPNGGPHFFHLPPIGMGGIRKEKKDRC